jgi:manganese/zinc/iron transport system permease protein
MFALENLIVRLLLLFFTPESINAFLRDPQHTAIIIGTMIAIAGALLGTFLLLRGMALTSDAISHTVLLGIVVAFMLMTGVFNMEPDTSSPWLIIGAAGAGVATVVLTELIFRSGLVRQDAALGLAFPLLFAIAIILVSGFVEDVHLDEDAVMVGEIGVAWANVNSHCFANCTSVTITPDDERANITRQCTNCRTLGISPRDNGAEFQEICTNCGDYTPAQAFREGFLDEQPTLVFFPKAITVTALMALLTIGFVTLFYKELKLASFDEALAKALGFRPAVLHYAIMVLVSLVAVGAFDAVGSILVIAFFIIPPAAAYLLTDRLSIMLILSAIIGSAGSVLRL